MGAKYYATKDGEVIIKLRNYDTGEIIASMKVNVKEDDRFNIDIEGVLE